MTTISKAVGIRKGITMMPNEPNDLRTVSGLLDRIALGNGGTAAAPGLWSTVRAILVAQLAAAIAAFQTVNRRPVIDGVVDPGGGTLRLMDQLAAAGRVSATVVRADESAQRWVVADTVSLDGGAALAARSISPRLTRRLVSVSGSSVKWFGVVVPRTAAGGILGGNPHLFFTPSPWQGDYHDGTYDRFDAWSGLWDKYTSAIGSQLVESGAPQILVIPFYRNAQTGSLGTFLGHWREVISEVVTATINSIDPLFLRDTYQFGEIFSSSFSNGITTHQNFNTQAAQAAAMTRMSFDLDGQAAGSNWRASRSVVYANTPVPRQGSPVSGRWHVGGRFARIRPSYPGTSDHNLCPFLLLHGLSRFGR